MTIRRWEAGKSTPRLDELNELARIFDTSVDYFTGQAGEKEVEKDAPTMAYWGGVLDNAKKAVNDGQNLSLIYSLLADAAGTVKSAIA